MFVSNEDLHDYVRSPIQFFNPRSLSIYICSLEVAIILWSLSHAAADGVYAVRLGQGQG